MKSRSQDRRSQRTREALRGAFVRLTLERGYESFGVADITEAANIGRSTFYQHYSGKLALLQDSLETLSRHLVALVGADPAPETLVPLLLPFREQRQRNRIFFSGPARSVWARVIARLVEPRLAKMARGAVPLVPLPLAALQIAEAQLSLIAGWLTGRSAVKPADMAKALIRTSHALTTALLGR
jgi:AcrR family transcriptional regulator